MPYCERESASSASYSFNWRAANLCGINRMGGIWVLLEELGEDDIRGEGASGREGIPHDRPLRLIEHLRMAEDLAQIVDESCEVKPIVLLTREGCTERFCQGERTTISRQGSATTARKPYHRSAADGLSALRMCPGQTDRRVR